MGEYLDFRKLNLGKESGDSLLSEIVNDAPLMKKLRELGVETGQIEHYLALLADYQDANRFCAKCKGLDSCQAPYYRMNRILYLDDSGFLSSKLGDCPLALEALSLRNNYLCRDFDDEWLSARLGRLKSARVEEVKKAFVNAFKSKTKRWVYVQGGSGSGKSYLTAAFTNTLAKKGYRVAFIDSALRFDELKGLAIKNKAEFEKRFQFYVNADALVLDDFGAGSKSEYLRDQILLPLLKARNHAMKFTVFLSDYSLSDAARLYVKTLNEKILGEQIKQIISKNIEKEITLETGFETAL